MSTTSDIDPRDARIAELEALLAQRDQELAERDERIAQLEAVVEEMRRRLGMDSTNSSKPPSTDSQKSRSHRKKRKTARQRGAQPGHQGHKRELWDEERVDHIHDHFPHECSCGAHLLPEHATGTFSRHQSFELPPKLIECTERRFHTCACPECGKRVAAKPTAQQRLGWGPRLTALLATMSVALHATRGKLDWFIENVLGAPSSKGSVQKYLLEASDALEPAHHQARRAVESAPVIGADETGWRKRALPFWIWLAQSPHAAFVLIRSSRKKECAEELLLGSQASVIVTDRYGGYTWLDQERNQVCRAHLLRDWKALAGRAGPLGTYGSRLVALEKQLHREWNQWRSGESSREAFVERAKQVRVKMEELCEEAGKIEKSPGVLRQVLKQEHRERGWVFLEHEDVALTNNQSERDVRTCVIQRKLSHGSQSEEGLALMERLWTVGLTCQRQGTSVLDFITQALQAHRLGHAPTPLV